MVPKPRRRAAWVTTRIDPSRARIYVEVAIHFLRARLLSEREFAELKSLAIQGIARYWSRAIKHDSRDFSVCVSIVDRAHAALKMKIAANRRTRFARSHNSGILTACVKYNGIVYAKKSVADRAFELTAAHEFGHSVLLAAGGWRHSWGHKGTVVSLMQRTRESAPTYPRTGEIDLMCYYNGIAPPFEACCARTQAAESDVRALVELGLESKQ